jgi:hypothetical protein
MYNNTRTYNTPLPGIPALPISWADAYRLLRGIQGPLAPDMWQVLCCTCLALLVCLPALQL